MKKTICDICGAETDGRNTNFSERLVNNKYIDLCPKHADKFDEIRIAALAPINTYLNCISTGEAKSIDDMSVADIIQWCKDHPTPIPNEQKEENK